MSKYWLILFLFLFNCVQAKTILPTIKNPFVKPTLISCDVLERQLISALNLWQYQGNIMTLSAAEKDILTIWLTNQKEWLTISNNTPEQLMPWQIISITSQEVIWQADLAHYCTKKLVVTMKFKGK